MASPAACNFLAVCPLAQLFSLRNSRTGRIQAAAASRRRSLPVKPSVDAATTSSETSSANGSFARIACKGVRRGARGEATTRWLSGEPS